MDQLLAGVEYDECPRALNTLFLRGASQCSMQWLLNPATADGAGQQNTCAPAKKVSKKRYKLTFDCFPSEIRLQVYDSLFTRSEVPIPITTSNTSWTITRPQEIAHSNSQTALLYCNRLLNSETIPILYSSHIFAIEIFTPTHTPIYFPSQLPRNFAHITRMQTYRLNADENLQVLHRFPNLREIELWLGFEVEEWEAFLRAAGKKMLGRIRKAVFVLHITSEVSGAMIDVWEQRRELDLEDSLSDIYKEMYGAIVSEPGVFPNHYHARIQQKRSTMGLEGFEHPGTLKIIVE